MSTKGILIALSLSVAQLCIPAASAVARTSRHAHTHAQNAEIGYMESLARAFNIALARAVIFGRDNPQNAQKTAAAVRLPALNASYVNNVLNDADTVQADPAALRTADSLTRQILSIPDDMPRDPTVQRDIAVMAASMLKGAIKADKPEVDRFCSTRRDDELCDLRRQVISFMKLDAP